MYVEKMQLHGFKSFVNRTEIPFARGITAIVGPNGCGKSNVSDAFRWVIGESNVRNLRGERIQDVIFKGTRTAKPTGMAEVVLSLRNDDGSLPLEYTSVGIARRIYRSGDSEFAINKVPCRLKDIRDLFSGTGLGSHGYAVIERPMIDEVLADRDETRRFLFEEAAGIVRYKQRRTEAQRKLEGVEGDLIRIEDMIREIEREVRSLARQSGKVRRWKRLKEELDRLEIRSALEAWRILRDRSEDAEQHHKSRAGKREELRSTLATLDARREVERQALLSLGDEVEEQQRDVHRRSEALREAEHERGVLAAQADAWTRQSENLNQRINRDSTRLSEAEAEHRSIAPRLLERAESLRVARERYEAARQAREVAEREMRETRAKLEQAQQTNMVLRSSQSSTQKDLESHETRIGQARHRLQGLAAHLSAFADREARCAAELASLETRLEELLEGIRVRQADRSAHGNERNEVQLRRQELSARRNDCSPRRARVESRLTILEEQRQRHEGFDAAVKWILERRDELPGVVGVVGEEVRLFREHSALGQAMLGDAVSWILVENVEAALSVIGRLREEQLGGVTFFPLDEAGVSPGKGDPEIAALFNPSPQALPFVGFLATHSLIESAENGVPERTETQRRIATRDGLLFGESGTLHLTGGRTQQTEILNREQEIPELRAELDALTNEIEAIDQEDETLRARERELGQFLARLEEELSAEERKKGQASEQRSGLRAELQMLREEEARLGEEHRTVENDLAMLTEDVLRLQGAVSQTSADSDRAQEAFEQTRREAESVEAVRDARLREAAEREMEALRQESEHRELESSQARLGREVEELRKSVTEMQSSLAHGDAESQAAEHRIADIVQSLVGLRSERDRAESALGTLKDRYAELQSKISDLETTLHETRGTLDQIVQTLHQEDVERARAEAEAEQIRRRVIEEYGLDLGAWSEAGGFPEPEPESDEEEASELTAAAAEPAPPRHEDEPPPETAADDDEEENWQAHLAPRRRRVLQLTEDDARLSPEERKDRIKELRARMEAMGSLNYLAEAEYEAQRERLEFHQKQASDLRTARTDLLEAIHKINETAGEMFRQTFESVQSRFQDVFTELFPGGEATLRLAGPDPLEDDIEISARPRGKRLESIRLLSTGERSLTAIALLFSIYTIKPSPVCLLDEVDAPLDDANLDRFLAMLQRMSERTQFICITHNKKTMQVAANLFGVTMEEPGISKIVSVRLNGGDLEPVPPLNGDAAALSDGASGM